MLNKGSAKALSFFISKKRKGDFNMLKDKCYVPGTANKVEAYMAYLGGVDKHKDFDKLPEALTREEMFWKRICANFTDLGLLNKKEAPKVETVTDKVETTEDKKETPTDKEDTKKDKTTTNKSGK